MQRLGASFGGQGARWGLASPYSAPQMPPCPMSETRPRPINGSVSLSDACLSFQVYGGSSPIIALWLGVDGMGEGGCCPGNPPPLPVFPFCVPDRAAVAAEKTGSTLAFPQDSCPGPSSFPSKKGLVAGGDPFLQPKYVSLRGALCWGPVAQGPPESVFPREMAG